MSTPIANVDMAAAWDGAEGENWAQHAERYDSSAARYSAILIDAAGISAPDRVLDIGCGNGGSTRASARAASSGSAVGIDLSSRMLERAGEMSRADGIANVEFIKGDAQVHPFEAHSFDAAISRFGAMFFADPVAAFANIGSALVPGGRLALAAWGEMDRNEWLTAIRGALAAGRTLPSPPMSAPGPFGLADPDHARRVLSEAGFTDIAIDERNEKMNFGADVDDAYAFLSDIGPVRGMLQDLDESTARDALGKLREAIAQRETPAGVLFGSSAWIITARSG
jgi:SAM-dependent methyltransferase